MTLVVARKIGGDAFIISETSAFAIESSKSDPLRLTQKVIPYRDCVVAFAGIIDVTHESFAFPSIEVPSIDDVLRLSINLSTRYSGKVHFVVISKESSEITYVENGKTENRQVANLGSVSAFSAYQEIFHSAEADTKLQAEIAAELSLVRMPDDSNDEFKEHYARSVRSFRKLLLQRRPDAGGFAIPYHVVPRGVSEFGFYMSARSGQNYRDWTEIGWSTVNFGFNEREFGSYAQSFTGSQSGYRITIPQILWEREWHSPFVARTVPPQSPFLGRVI